MNDFDNLSSCLQLQIVNEWFFSDGCPDARFFFQSVFLPQRMFPRIHNHFIQQNELLHSYLLYRNILQNEIKLIVHLLQD